jgi:polyhydroxyalkanoate synthesis repressor PhaR
MAPSDQNAAGSEPPVVVKKYANRRLYNTESSSYITLDNLAEMVRHGRDFVVYDARTGEDITRSVLTQIIVEEESKVGRAMLPIPFLRQLIGFYGDSLQGVVPRYLEQSMATFARQQQQMRDAVQQTMGSFLPPGFEEMGRQNMAMLERAMTLFSPFYRAPEAAARPEPPPAESEPDAAALLRAEVEQLRQELSAARAALPAQPSAAVPETRKAGAE